LNATTLLTDTKIKNARAREKEYNLSDPGGLQLRIKPSGLKVWLFNYRKPISKKRTNFKLGKYPDCSLANARKKKIFYRELLANGVDPQEYELAQFQKKENEHATTLVHVTDKWFKVKSSDITSDYAKDIYNSLSNHIFPAFIQNPLF